MGMLQGKKLHEMQQQPMPALFSFPCNSFFYRLFDKHKILSEYFHLRALICVIELVFM